MTQTRLAERAPPAGHRIRRWWMRAALAAALAAVLAVGGVVTLALADRPDGSSGPTATK